jgi:hypothetical protein
VPVRNITGNHLGDTSLNIPNGTAGQIDVWGTTEMRPTIGQTPTGEQSVVTLEPGSKWIGGFTADPYASFLVYAPLHGSTEGVFQNTLSNIHGSALIDAPVVGTGAFLNQEFKSHGQLQFLQSVSAGQTVFTEGEQGDPSTTMVYQPQSYHAHNVLGFGEIILQFLKATSYSLHHDMLTLFQGNAVAYTMNLEVNLAPGGGRSFGVSQTSLGIDIHADGVKPGLALLPAH